MFIKLKQDIRENIRMNSLGAVTDPGKLKESVRRGRRYPFVAGRVIELSDESAKKYLEANVAEPHGGPADDGIPLAQPDEAGAAASAPSA